MLRRITSDSDVSEIVVGDVITEKRSGEIEEKFTVKTIYEDYFILVSSNSGNSRLVMCPKRYLTEDHWYFEDGD